MLTPLILILQLVDDTQLSTLQKWNDVPIHERNTIYIKHYCVYIVNTFIQIMKAFTPGLRLQSSSESNNITLSDFPLFAPSCPTTEPFSNPAFSFCKLAASILNFEMGRDFLELGDAV